MCLRCKNTFFKQSKNYLNLLYNLCTSILVNGFDLKLDLKLSSDNFIIITILTLKGISSEIGCHVKSADCHLAVPDSRRNLPLPFCFFLFFSLYLFLLFTSRAPPQQGSSLPSIPSPDYTRSQSESSLFRVSQSICVSNDNDK